MASPAAPVSPVARVQADAVLMGAVMAAQSCAGRMLLLPVIPEIRLAEAEAEGGRHNITAHGLAARVVWVKS